MGLSRLSLLITVGLLFILGLTMIFGTSSAEVLDNSLDVSTHTALVHHLFSASLGCGLAALSWLIGYRNLLKLSLPILAIVSFLLLLVLIPGVGLSVNGARRWISIGGLSIQPSEFVKVAVPLYFTYEMRRYKNALTLPEFLVLLAKVSFPMLLVLLEPDNGTTGIIGLTLISLFLLARVPARYWVLPMVILSLIGGVAAWNLPYVQSRLKVYLNPELDVRGRGHQPLQARIAAGSGGLLGKGPGKSLQKLSYLPEAQNDYIAAIYAEEFGYVGVLFLVVLYMLLAAIGFRIAMFAPDAEGMMLAGALTFLISIQAFLNLGVVSGLLPSTGLNLPLFSQGGSSLMANMIALGILLNIARESEKSRVKRRGNAAAALSS